MPVITMQSSRPGSDSASDLNSTSTAGRNEFTGLLLVRRTNGSESFAPTSRCFPPGATSTSPARSGRPSSASRTRSFERRSSEVASDAVKRAGMCCTISTGTRRSAGSFGISSASALGPPVEQPIATTSITGTLPRDFGFGGATVGRARCSRPSRNASITVVSGSRSAAKPSSPAFTWGLVTKSNAPACSASMVMFAPLVVRLETMMMPASGTIWRSFGIASTPFITGISTSSRITSGRSSAALAIASLPSTAVPTQRTSGISRRQPCTRLR